MGRIIDTIARLYNIHDINPNYTWKQPIAAVQTLSRNGKLIENDVVIIGELLSCQDWQTYWPAKNLVPVYYEITINNRKFRAAGAGTSPKFPQYDVLPGGGGPMVSEGYPEFGVTYLNYSATVLPSTPGKTGGTLQIGNLGFVDGVPREYYDHSGLGILRVLVPTQ